MKYISTPLPVSAFKILLAGLLAAIVSASSAQTVLVDDKFDAVTVNGSGTSQTVTSGDYTYRALANGNLFSGSGSGSLSFHSDGYSAGYITFSPATLSSIGDYIEVSFKITYPSGAGAADRGLRFGLYNIYGDINTALATQNGVNAVGDTAKGYYIGTNPGSTIASGSQVGKDLGNSVTTSGTAVIGGGQGTSTVGSTFASNSFDNSPQEIVLKITKTDTGINISGSIAGSAFSVDNTTNYYDSFDTFIFGNGLSAGAWRMDDLKITTGSSIPEPSTVAQLIGLGTIMAGVLLRRKK
ncbi:hypothetical protein OpiT1DRAFT_01060 [Opitutaceae bacterium TAV1]|nr:hypothetical protein OpiT1DRAFT_01060 [Opitutaceae bacterium TAV1]